MGRLFIISNRLPVTLSLTDGKIDVERSPGGLATGLSSYYEKAGGMWFGWPGLNYDSVDDKTSNEIERLLKEEYNCGAVPLGEDELKKYYYGFSNRTVWPLFHYFANHTVFENDLCQSYKRVNKKFCDTILKFANEKDTIWIHDYQLMLLPGMLRRELPDASIGYFHHIPFPSFELFRLLPWRRSILNGLLGADLIGFHTYDYVRHFLSSVRRILGHENILGVVASGYQTTRVDAFPMGIDFDKWSKAWKDPDVKDEIDRIWREIGARKIVLSIDRLDYTKGIKERLEAFHLFLHRNPEYRQKVTLIMVAVPSRTAVDSYAELKNEVDQLVGRINGAHGSLGWMPIWYLYRSVPYSMLAALYCFADIALVTPLRDGMNLVAKEFIATRCQKRGGDKGVLILSEMAGAEKELGEAVIVNPYDSDKVAEAIAIALKMPAEEQKNRMIPMQRRLQRYDIKKWANDFLGMLESMKNQQKSLYSRKLTGNIRLELLDNYRKSRQSILLLDYDGTLRQFVENPSDAYPNQEILQILEILSDDKKCKLVLVSGRDKNTLQNWFGSLNINIVADHGAWLKDSDCNWEMLEPLNTEWMQRIRPIIQHYVDRTPGAFLEEKDFSLVFHFRRAIPELAAVRVNELVDDLRALTSTLNLGILEGNKVLEIKNTNINKGSGIKRFLGKTDWDFIMAVGDDWTDEDMFRVLPENAYTIKVGLVPSNAKYHLDDVDSVLGFLRELIEWNKQTSAKKSDSVESHNLQ